MSQDNSIKGVLFDLDGVLLDSEGTYSHFWSEVDRAFPTGVANFAQVIKGSNLHNILHTYFHDEATRREVVAMLNAFQRDMRYECFPGAVALLEDLRRHDVPCCIVTSSDRAKMTAMWAQLPALQHYFAAIVTGEMVAEPKPSPECFLLGAKLLGLDIKECAVVEDSINGLRAGMASGAKVIGVTTTCTASQVEPHCHHMVDTVADLNALTFINL